MLVRSAFRQTNRQWIFIGSRTASGSAQPNEHRSSTLNQPGFYTTGNVNVQVQQQLKNQSEDAVPLNDLLEAKRTQSQTEKKDEQMVEPRRNAFLQRFRSILPFLSTRKVEATSIDIATTRESFIPLTRPSLIRLIATDSQFLDDPNHRPLFHQLCQGFDSAVLQRYQTLLNELKYLFNPLSPDNETLDNRRVSYRDRLDNEYWLLQKIDHLLHRANFTELSSNVLVNKFLLHENSPSTLQIEINGYDYDVLKFWVLGRDQMQTDETSGWRKLFRRPRTSSSDYFKRVIVAVRMRGQDRLYLKAFRDISLQNLTQLLPTGELQMGTFDRKLLGSAVILGASTMFTHLLSTMANYHISGLLAGGSGLSLALVLWSITRYYRSKITYLSSMNRTLFFKNVASSKQLLAMIVDRAVDELSKEVLLTYMFIQWKQKEKSPLTIKNLELDIEHWIEERVGTHVNFNSQQSLEFLRQIGILLPDDAKRPGIVQVLPFNDVVHILPKASRTLSEKNEEWDLIEGYDKKYFEIDWKLVRNEEEQLNQGGWH